MEKKSGYRFRFLLFIAVVVAALLVVFSSYTIVRPGHRGVVVWLGRVEDTSLTEGFHLILPPVVRQVVPVDVRTKKLEVITEAASSDLQIINVTGVLNYHLEPMQVGKLYREVGVGYESIIIVPALEEAIKASTSQFRVEEVLVERAVLKQLIQAELTKRLADNDIVVDQFSLANVEFSSEFNQAIERKQVAEQAALQKKFELQSAERDVEITLAKAEGERKSAVIAAAGRAEARLVEAKAEAEALNLIAEQLRNNPALIQYEWASRLSPNVSTVLLPSDQGLILNADSLVSPTGAR